MLYTCCSLESLDPSLERHLHSRTCQSAELVKQGCYHLYQFEAHGQIKRGGGLLSILERTYYPDYERSTARRSKGTLIKGSSAKIGKQVDSQIANLVEGRIPKRMHKWAKALKNVFKSLGHTYQAAQVPVVLEPFWSERMAQADLITKDRNGKLWLWEIKTGMPVAFKKNKGVCFKGTDIPCTVLGIWLYQVCFTETALKEAGFPIFQSRVIQVYDKRNSKTGILEAFTDIVLGPKMQQRNDDGKGLSFLFRRQII